VVSRNRGITLARGKYIAILDSDDISLPDRLAKQVDFMESNPEVGACGSYYYVIDGADRRKASVMVPVNARDAKTFLYFNVCFCHSTLFMRTSVARQIRYRTGFDIIEDYEIAYRISKKWKVANLPAFTTLYRVHGNNISIDKKERMLNTRKTMDSIVLNDLGIAYSADELDLHTNFINMNVDFFASAGRLRDLERWLTRFMERMRMLEDVNMGLVKRIIAIRWFLVCYRSGQYGRILNNRLFSGIWAEYLGYNLRYLKNLATKSLEVV
jgi:glycosyltransferase involved in cell wall biosynthesis